MNPIKFIDNRFQELSAKLAREQFTVFGDAEQNALKCVLAVFRFVMAAFMVPVVFARYALVVFRILPAPIPEIDLLKARHNELETEKAKQTNKKAKKLGFQPKPLPAGGDSNALN